MALELKADNGVLRPLQKFKLDQVKRCAGYWVVSSPLTWQKDKALLTRLDNGELE